MKSRFAAMLLACTGVLALCCSSSKTRLVKEEQVMPNSNVSIDASATYQTIDNFGASDAWSMDVLGKYWTEENKTRVADLLFSREKGIGLSAWRFNIGAGSTETDQAIIKNPWRRAEAFKSSEDGDYDWNKQAGQQWFLKAAKARGVDTLIAFVNSPPVWMTKNGHAQPDATVGSTNLKVGYEDEFAAYLIAVLEHFQQEGLEFQYISPMNEPTWDWNKAGQEGNRYNNDDLKRVILELYGQLKANGLETQISAPDGVEVAALLDDEYYKQFTNDEQYTGGSNARGMGKYREYIKDLLGDPQMKESIGNKIASHSYWSDYNKPGDDRLGELRELLAANLKKYDQQAKYWMTEYCILGSDGPGRDLGIDAALRVASTIHYDLTEAKAAAWQWWTAVSKEDYKDGLIYTDYKNPGDKQSILPSKILWVLGNYSKFISPGAERVALTGLNDQARSGLLGSAYIHKGEQTVTAVFVNDGQEDRPIKLTLQGLDAASHVSTMQTYVTSAGSDLARGDDIAARTDGTLEVVILARSVMTLYGKQGQKEPKLNGFAQQFQTIPGGEAAQDKYAGYLFTYFKGEGSADGEQIYFALSDGNDPLHWKELNGGKPVMNSLLGERGVRDPSIIRSPEGNKFYLIATDLKINGNGNWDRAQRQGSRSIMVWESSDLVNWSEQRMVEVSSAEAGDTWAPEAFYDDAAGEYVLFWASKMYVNPSHAGNTDQKIMYSKTRDFHSFTEPQVYMDSGYSVIDTTMIANKGKIYRFTKDERDRSSASPYGKRIFQEAGSSVFAPRFSMIQEGVGGMGGIEGPTVFKSNTEEKWYLFVDEFGGRGYVPLETTDLDSGVWTSSSPSALPAGSRHGTVIPITQTEYDAIYAKYGTKR